MLRIGYFSIIFTLAIACSSEQPPERWDEEEVVYILADLHIIQSALKQVKRDSAVKKETQHINYLLNIYDLNREELNEIVNYAQSDEKKAALIYDRVIQHLDSVFKHNEAIHTKKK